MVRQRRSSSTEARRGQPSTRSFWERKGGQRVVFSVLAITMVLALIVAAVGTDVIDALTASPDDNTFVTDERADEFEQSLREELEEHPDDTATMALLANLLAHDGDLAEAIVWYERALALTPDEWSTRLDFAQSLANGGKSADAEVQFLNVIAAQPNHGQAHFYLAELYRSWQPPRTAEAIIEYRQVIALSPDAMVAEYAAQELARLGYPVATPAIAPATPGSESGP